MSMCLLQTRASKNTNLVKSFLDNAPLEPPHAAWSQVLCVFENQKVNGIRFVGVLVIN